MSVFASCGHEITSEWMCDPRSSVEYPCQDRDGTPAVSYACYCEPCAAELHAAIARGDYGSWPEWHVPSGASR